MNKKVIGNEKNIIFYNDEEGNPQVHHELSQFKMIQNRWFYVTGEFLD